MQVLQGQAVSPGVAIGPAWVIDPRGLRLPPRAISPDAVAAELDRLEVGLRAAALEAEAAEAEARARLGPEYAAILGAHARMIADPSLRRDARARIERDAVAAEHAVLEVLDGLAARLEGLADVILAARAADVRDVEMRILDSLAREAGGTASSAASEQSLDLATPSVLLAHDISPSQTATLDPSRALGFATEAGGRTSHTAIVAAGLEIPAVVGVGPFLEAARTARTVILDGDDGLVILDPDAATLRKYRRTDTARAARTADLASLLDLPAETRDGTRVELLGNIEFPGEVAACRDRGALGIGLYRTEFLYLGADEPPTEEEQLTAYRAVAKAMRGRPITIRTLDLGADKLLRRPGPPVVEPNPFLGLRSLRLSLRDPVLFRTQLRAILRVATEADVRVMFPLVSTLGEFRKAKALLGEIARELEAEGLPARGDLPVGAMIEVPSAALMADRLATEVDFFSIGTNDLVQYTLAVDRTNETVADLYSAADPAVLRLLRMVVEAAKPTGLPVNVCGTMGGDPLYTRLLVGLGLRMLSMPPTQVPEVKRVVRSASVPEAEALAARCLRDGHRRGGRRRPPRGPQSGAPRPPPPRREPPQGPPTTAAPGRRLVRHEVPGPFPRDLSRRLRPRPNPNPNPESAPSRRPPRAKPLPTTLDATKVRLRFAKRGDLRLVSHHDLMRCLERMLRRADLPMAHTQGFNPRPKYVLAQALALGIEGRREVLELELSGPIEAEEVRRRLSEVAPPGFEVLEAEAIPPGRAARPTSASYQLGGPVPAERIGPARAALSTFLASDRWPLHQAPARPHRRARPAPSRPRGRARPRRPLLLPAPDRPRRFRPPRRGPRSRRPPRPARRRASPRPRRGRARRAARARRPETPEGGPEDPRRSALAIHFKPTARPRRPAPRPGNRLA